MVDISHTPALGYMEIVAQRDAATLLPIINAHIAPGTEVWSDEWNAYRRVGTLPNVSRHRTVNHSVNFVDPVTGVHTSLVPRPYKGEERAWYTLLAHAPGAPEKCGAPDTIVYLVYDAYSVYALR